MSEFTRKPLTSDEINQRLDLTCLLVGIVVRDNLLTDLKSVYLFGSLARGEGHVGSDVDLAFGVERSLPFTKNGYLEDSDLLLKSINLYRDSLNIPYPVKPTLIEVTWYFKHKIVLYTQAL
mgnify:CR=1 FL=1